MRPASPDSAIPIPNTSATSIGCPRSAKSRTSGIWTTSAQGSNSRSTASKSPGSLYKSFTRTWADVYESLDRSEFGRYADIRNPFKDEVAAIVARNADDERRQLHEILKFVQSRIAWDGTYRLTPESSPHAAVDKRRGDSGSINFILAAAPARRRIQTGNHPAQSPLRRTASADPRYRPHPHLRIADEAQKAGRRSTSMPPTSTRTSTSCPRSCSSTTPDFTVRNILSKTGSTSPRRRRASSCRRSRPV